MQIQILSIQTLPKTSAKGKPYEALDIAFKNLTFQGKVEGKQLMPFGGNAPGFATLKNAQPGQTYDIAVVKNDAGYNDWTAATLSDGTAPPPASPQTGGGSKPNTNASSTNSRGFETPEERAAKQVYIVRQSSLSAAVATLSVGGKSALKPADVIAVAGQYEAFVFGNNVAEPAADGFSDMLDDVPL